MTTVRIAIGQINTIVGDLKGNTDKILFCIKEALKKEVDLIAFPELSITGYPPEDLLLKPHFIKENLAYLKKITHAVGNIISIVGFVDKDAGGIYNSAAVIYNKKLIYIYHKRNLPNYGVFDEKRYFKPGDENVILASGDFSFAVNICEDIWAKEETSEERIFSKAGFLVNISASVYHCGKMEERKNIIGSKAKKFRIPIVYCNLVGAQDELVFDGRSSVFEKDGKIFREAKAFEEDLAVLDLALSLKTQAHKKPSKVKVVNINYKAKAKSLTLPKPKAILMSREEELYSALKLAVRDYVQKNNFNKVALGLSGGIDSGLVALIAVDALGKENVLSISMPSRYSSSGTQQDAETIAKNLGIRFCKMPIDNIFDAYIEALSLHFKGMPPDAAEENIQARIRGNILMAFSNKFGYLVLTTGNKSETSVGYCTLYGDMAGGFAVIKDVPKRLVYELANYRNKKEGKEIIPRSVFERAPSAELRPNQKDEDMLPPYDLLDKIIDLYIEQNKGPSDIVKEIGNKDIVKKALKMIDVNEYKRRQAPIGVKITPCSFGKDRRMPITNKFTEDRL